MLGSAPPAQRRMPTVEAAYLVVGATLSTFWQGRTWCSAVQHARRQDRELVLVLPDRWVARAL